MKNEKYPKVSLTIFSKSGVRIRRYDSMSKNRFGSVVSQKTWSKHPFLAKLHVSYGMKETNTGTTEEFTNDGEYDNIADLKQAFYAFLEAEESAS